MTKYTTSFLKPISNAPPSGVFFLIHNWKIRWKDSTDNFTLLCTYISRYQMKIGSSSKITVIILYKYRFPSSSKYTHNSRITFS